MYARRTPPQEPPCLTCRVELAPENEDAGMVFMLCRNQVVTVGQGQPVDLSLPAVLSVMDLLGVRDRKSCLFRVRDLWHALEKERRQHAGS